MSRNGYHIFLRVYRQSSENYHSLKYGNGYRPIVRANGHRGGGEHLVSTVAPKNNGSFQCAFCYELSMYLETRFAVKIEPGSGANG